MSTTFRAAPALLLLNLTLITAAFAQSNAPVATPVRGSAADEASVRALTEQYGRAIAAGDLEALRKFWNPQSPNLPAQSRLYKNVFVHARIEFINPQVTRLEITGDKAVSHLTVDERRLDNKTAAVLLTLDPLRGSCRSFEWVKTSTGWQIEREVLVQDELAAKLVAARSDQEIDEILEKEKRFVNSTLLGTLSTRMLRYSTRAEYDTAMRHVHVQRIVAERLGDQIGIGASWMNTAIVKHAQDENEAALQAAHKALAIYESLNVKPGLVLALLVAARRFFLGSRGRSASGGS